MLPDSLEGWRVEAVTIAGQRRAVARRGQRTFIIVGTRRTGWHVSLLRGGRMVREHTVRHLPPDVVAAVLARS